MGNVALRGANRQLHRIEILRGYMTKAISRLRMLSSRKTLLLAGAILFFRTDSGVAQNRTLGEISGTVTDPAGARIPNAQILLTNTLTSVNTETRANSDGVYDVNTLVPGTYTISVSKENFKTFVSKNILLRAEAIGVNAVLEVGSVNQQVTVAAAATLLETQSPEQRTDVSSELVLELPNVGLSELSYEALLPGVAPAGIGGGANGLNDNSWVAVNGSTSQHAKLDHGWWYKNSSHAGTCGRDDSQ